MSWLTEYIIEKAKDAGFEISIGPHKMDSDNFKINIPELIYIKPPSLSDGKKLGKRKKANIESKIKYNPKYETKEGFEHARRVLTRFKELSLTNTGEYREEFSELLQMALKKKPDEFNIMKRLEKLLSRLKQQKIAKNTPIVQKRITKGMVEKARKENLNATTAELALIVGCSDNTILRRLKDE